MEKARAITAHQIPDRPPLRLAIGDEVETGDVDTTWPQFIYVTTARGEGWVPSRYVATDGGRGVAKVGYDTTELATTAGEKLDILRRDDESGWHWCRNREGDEGWVPISTIEEVE